MKKNPIFPGLGVCDPHVRVFDGKAYLYASHDKSSENTTFCMEDWWILSSDDLVTWKHEYTLKPEETYIGAGFQKCFAMDAAKRNGKYYLYFSEEGRATGVVVSDTPVGPWTDPLKKPLISTDDIDGRYAHDPGIFIDTDDVPYMVVGLNDYYIAKLGDDMISLAEKPRKIEIVDPQGPMGPGQTDDKPYIHKYRDVYYLSWGCYYGMSDNVYGPYVCKGSFIKEDVLSPEFRYDSKRIQTRDFEGMFEYLDSVGRPSTFDRHGSFFEWKGQWYFICNDISSSQDVFFRDTSICKITYDENGEINPVVFE